MARNYKKEYQNYQGTELQKKNRYKRNTANRQAKKAGTIKKGSDKEVCHKKALIKGGTNAKSNRKICTAAANRSFKRTKSARMK